MFSLDDVRDSYTNDMTRFLTEVEKGSKAIASASALAPGDRMWQPPINAMVVGLHGIAGSSSLVGVETMAITARRLEDVAAMANESVLALRVHLERLKRIASTCLEGTSDLRVMLEHELAGRKTEAGIRRGLLEKKLEQAVKTIAATLDQAAAPLPVEGERSAPVTAPIPAPARLPAVPAPKIPPIAVVAAPKPVSDEGWGIDEELLQVFQTEAREAMTNLRGYLTRLEQHGTDREAATHCARLLHLLKGAAASVGLDEISARSRDLHAEVERLRSVGFDPASLEKLRQRVEALIAFSVPDLAAAPAEAAPAAPPAAASTVVDDELAIFREEAHSSLDEARALLQQVRQTAGTARGVLTTRLERILHRLKGSALIVGEAQAAAVASRGQALCEALERVDPEAVASVLEQLANMVKGHGRGGTKGPSLVRINLPPQGEWDVYLEESSGLLDEIDQTLSRIESSNRPTVELSNLFRSYHTLKGATNAVGLHRLEGDRRVVDPTQRFGVVGRRGGRQGQRGISIACRVDRPRRARARGARVGSPLRSRAGGPPR
jgi:chemotaxis protein histidine kinase CheA